MTICHPTPLRVPALLLCAGLLSFPGWPETGHANNNASSAGAQSESESDAAALALAESLAEPAPAMLPDPAADLPAAVIEEPDEEDLTAGRSATPAALAGAAENGVGNEAAGGVSLALAAGQLPLTVSSRHFHELMSNSPFTRALNLSDSLILTGVARVDGKPVATLMDLESKETYVISDVPNPQGWKMVDISQGVDLEQVTAKISVAGGEVVTVRFDENRLKPGEAKPAGGPGAGQGGPPRRDGGESDEERRRRYAEFREKMDKLSEEQKDRMRKIVEKKMRDNPNMSREDRGRAFREAMEEVSSRR